MLPANRNGTEWEAELHFHLNAWWAGYTAVLMESKGGAICTDSIIIYKDRGCPNSSSRYITDGCWPLKASVQQKAGGCGDRKVRGAGWERSLPSRYSNGGMQEQEGSEVAWGQPTLGTRCPEKMVVWKR